MYPEDVRWLAMLAETALPVYLVLSSRWRRPRFSRVAHMLVGEMQHHSSSRVSSSSESASPRPSPASSSPPSAVSSGSPSDGGNDVDDGNGQPGRGQENHGKAMQTCWFYPGRSNCATSGDLTDFKLVRRSFYSDGMHVSMHQFHTSPAMRT